MYLPMKTLHIVLSTILFETGIGTAFFMWMANRNGNRPAIAVVTGHVMGVDFYHTTPAVIVQPLSGFILMLMAGYPLDFTSPNWLGLSVLLYCVAGVCWLPVLWRQWKMLRIAASSPWESPLPTQYWKYEKLWVLLGIPAFFSHNPK